MHDMMDTFGTGKVIFNALLAKLHCLITSVTMANAVILPHVKISTWFQCHMDPVEFQCISALTRVWSTLRQMDSFIHGVLAQSSKSFRYYMLTCRVDHQPFSRVGEKDALPPWSQTPVQSSPQ